MGAGVILASQGIQTYIIDSYSLHAASGKSASSFIRTTADPLTPMHSALAAVTFLRAFAGFGFPIFAPGMFKALGYGVGNTVLAVVVAVIGIPACASLLSLLLSSTVSEPKAFSPILFWKFGERIRNASTFAVKTPLPTKPNGS